MGYKEAAPRLFESLTRPQIPDDWKLPERNQYAVVAETVDEDRGYTAYNAVTRPPSSTIAFHNGFMEYSRPFGFTPTPTPTPLYLPDSSSYPITPHEKLINGADVQRKMIEHFKSMREEEEKDRKAMLREAVVDPYSGELLKYRNPSDPRNIVIDVCADDMTRFRLINRDDPEKRSLLVTFKGHPTSLGQARYNHIGVLNSIHFHRTFRGRRSPINGRYAYQESPIVDFYRKNIAEHLKTPPEGGPYFSYDLYNYPGAGLHHILVCHDDITEGKWEATWRFVPEDEKKPPETEQPLFVEVTLISPQGERKMIRVPNMIDIDAVMQTITAETILDEATGKRTYPWADIDRQVKAGVAFPGVRLDMET